MITYVNYAGLAPLRPESYIRSLLAPELLGNMGLPHYEKQSDRLREKVAAWIGCRPHQVAFFPSTSMALSMVAHAIPWQEGDTVLYPADDFASNIQAWEALEKFHAKSQGTKHWSTPWPESTRLISLSTVNFSTGIEATWQSVVAEARSKNIWTCVDAIQSAGIKPCWNPDIDFWCAGTQKWLVSGLGLAIVVFSDRVLSQLKPPFPNWLGLNTPADISSGMSNTARGWEIGWITPTALSRFESSLDYFNKIGWNTVTEKVKERRDYLHEQLLEMGMHVVSCPKAWSGIVSFAPGAEQAERVVTAGYDKRIIMAKRGDYVRLSPHMFNSMKRLHKVSQWLNQSAVQSVTIRSSN